ncbi:MAG: SPOR domain-containing protein [Pseudomonadales bacterium]|jgi:hypothetical protein|nr:SPOR domain-containing protein [Pseudomonadales bacterium]MDP6472850.1 SPOR domain-containing protein [Pseudomonadales bacterium]MDP6826394.1 SPOR domain-containing protein [Pseudomonadales bacterium]MDP6972530.1 SPOR domain-containing protein [Pseudomonadales bacterium]|tara:strand:+ start:56 stop:568 length:513 start_codon:yes stop_codon:yes gene_type:complete
MKISAALLLGLLTAAPPALAETEYWVCIASFQARENAESALAEAGGDLVDPLSVVTADTPKGMFYRVVAGPYLSRDVAETGAIQAREEGYGGAWVLTMRGPVSIPSDSVYDDDYGGDYELDLSFDDDLPVYDDDFSLSGPAERIETVTEYEQMVRTPPEGYQLHRMKRSP